MKKQINILAISILFLMILSSCTKFGKNVTIEGRVENPITGEGISGVKIVLEKETLEIPGGIKSIKEVYTDANGSFELNKFSFRASQITANTGTAGDYYKIGWHKDGEYVSTNSTLEIKKGKKLYVDFHMVPYGDYRIVINNINCQGATDTMWFRNKWLGYTGFESSYSTSRIGCYSYTSASPFKIPIGTYIYETKVKRSGNITFVYDTVTVNETGVSTIFIDY